MKLKFIFTIFLFLTIILFFVFSTDVRILGVKLYPQKKSTWCWAASIAMVNNFEIGYSKDTINQCKLLDSLSCDCCDSKVVCRGDTCDDCENLLLKNQFEDLLNTLPFTYDTLTNILDSSQITQQIDLNKPFIVGDIVQETGVGLWAQHYFVGFGYINTFDKQWVFIRDPWQTCVGCTYAIPYSAIKNGGENISRIDPIQTPFTYYNFTPKNKFTTPTIEKYFYSFIHYFRNLFSINKLKNSTWGFSFSDINDKNNLKQLTPLLKNAPTELLQQIGITDKSLSNFQVSKAYLGKNILLSPKENSIELAKRIITSDETIVIVNVLDENGIPISGITLVKNGDFWEVSKFASCPWLPFAKSVAKNAITTRFTKFDLSKVIEKEHFTLLPTQYQFYKIEYEGQIYYFPKNNYSDIQNTFYTQATFAYEIAPKIAKEYYQNLLSSKSASPLTNPHKPH